MCGTTSGAESESDGDGGVVSEALGKLPPQGWSLAAAWRRRSQDRQSGPPQPLGRGRAPTVPAFLNFPCQLNGTRGRGGTKNKICELSEREAGHEQGQLPLQQHGAAHWARRHESSGGRLHGRGGALSACQAGPTHTPATPSSALRVRGLHAATPSPPYMANQRLRQGRWGQLGDLRPRTEDLVPGEGEPAAPCDRRCSYY